jgi:hypothetical protein
VSSDQICCKKAAAAPGETSLIFTVQTYKRNQSRKAPVFFAVDYYYISAAVLWISLWKKNGPL